MDAAWRVVRGAGRLDGREDEMTIRFYHGWRWKRFDLGFGIEVWGGVDIWLMFGLYYCGVEIWRK